MSIVCDKHLTDEVIAKAFENTNFGRDDFRTILAETVMKQVKLPKERLTSEFEDEFFDRRIYLKDEVKAALREAGIQIEGDE